LLSYFHDHQLEKGELVDSFSPDIVVIDTPLLLALNWRSPFVE
jgi:hypothetical protein